MYSSLEPQFATITQDTQSVKKNNGNTEKLENRICVDHIETTSVGNYGSFTGCLHSAVLMPVY
jgi:hypothetical protein